MEKYKISQISKICKISTHTIRYYDKLKLIPNVYRDKNNNRYFSNEHIQCFNKIKALQEAGFSLDSIAQMYICGEIDKHILKQTKQNLLEELDNLQLKLDKINNIDFEEYKLKK